MPYFPLVVVFCQKYVRNTGIGTVVALMLPFSITFLVVWSLFLFAWMTLGLPLGPGASYVYPPTQ
jgi:aminobenzoyl-glutamate transport protein